MSLHALATAPGHYLYFGYASNLLRQRLQLANRSAEFVAIGRLAGHRIEFSDPHHSWPAELPRAERTWHGGAATLVETPDCDILGAVWSMAEADADSLDRQEGVEAGIYERVSVAVELMLPDGSGGTRECRCYRMVRLVPLAPSPHYLDVILRGAVQCGLPAGYVDSLRRREHNGFSGECKKYAEVMLACADGMPPCQVEALQLQGRI